MSLGYSRLFRGLYRFSRLQTSDSAESRLQASGESCRKGTTSNRRPSVADEGLVPTYAADASRCVCKASRLSQTLYQPSAGTLRRKSPEQLFLAFAEPLWGAPASRRTTPLRVSTTSSTSTAMPASHLLPADRSLTRLFYHARFERRESGSTSFEVA